MKILFTQKMNGVSGSELYLLQILAELKLRSYEVEMLLIYPSFNNKNKEFVERLKGCNITTYEIYGHYDLSLILFYKIFKLLKRGKYDIVQSNLVHADLWMAIQKILFRNNMRLISVKHGFDEKYSAKYGNNPRYLKKSLFYWLQKFSGWFIDYNVTISKGLYDMYIKGKIISPDKTRNIYYGLDLAVRYSKNEQNPNEMYALILGRLVKYKGHELLLKAWQKVKAANNNWKLYIIGDGDYKNELTEIAKKLELDESVRFCGFKANPHQYIRDSRFMLVTSIWEGFGLIMLESWLHKKPVIAFNVPAMNEIIKKDINGMLVKAFDTDELAGKIIYYFQNPEIVRQHGAAGYQDLTSYFTVARMTDEMCDVYTKVFNSSN